MNSSSKEIGEPSSSGTAANITGNGDKSDEASSESLRPPAKRPPPFTVIEISDTDSDDSDVCAVTTYQATADEVKRIRGEDYSSSSSSSDYSSDSGSAWEDDSIVLDNEKAGQKGVRAQLNLRANRMDDPKLNPALKYPEVIDSLQTHWVETKDYISPEATIISEPFRVCLVHRLLSNPEIINNIVDDMNTLDWTRKKMDLYEFHQTADLASLTWQRSIRGIYELLKTDLMSWVSQLTGLELTSVSASCSLYGPGDHLLVHDDLLADRRVAFILYLAPWTPRTGGCDDTPTPRPLHNGAGDTHNHTKTETESEEGWSPEMGGALELVAHDTTGPTHVVRQVYPRNNMLALFQVGRHSYHQVSEVLSMELPRLSINGWFHGPELQSETAMELEPAPPPPPMWPERPHTEVVLLNQWLEATYMSPRSRLQIQAQMERESEVCLHSLLQRDKHQQLLEALRSTEIPWERVGPSNQRHYSVVPASWVATLATTHAVRALLQLVTSGAFCRMLADCTDLTLNTHERLELQRWTPGDYSLLPPRDQYQHSRLEAVIYLGVPERPICGGNITYVAPEEGEEAAGSAGGVEGALVSLPPQDNALNLVYCDAGAAAFTKYLSRMTMTTDQCFYILTCTYRE